jgi:hypothetical protein
MEIFKILISWECESADWLENLQSKLRKPGLHPILDTGCHPRLAEGVFALLMKEQVIEPPDISQKQDDFNFDWFKWFLDSMGKGRKGTSTLNKWTCPECGLNVRIGIKGDPELRYELSEQKSGHVVFFVRADGVENQIELEDILLEEPREIQPY